MQDPRPNNRSRTPGVLIALGFALALVAAWLGFRACNNTDDAQLARPADTTATTPPAAAPMDSFRAVTDGTLTDNPAAMGTANGTSGIATGTGTGNRTTGGGRRVRQATQTSAYVERDVVGRAASRNLGLNAGARSLPRAASALPAGWADEACSQNAIEAASIELLCADVGDIWRGLHLEAQAAGGSVTYENLPELFRPQIVTLVVHRRQEADPRGYISDEGATMPARRLLYIEDALRDPQLRQSFLRRTNDLEVRTRQMPLAQQRSADICGTVSNALAEISCMPLGSAE